MKLPLLIIILLIQYSQFLQAFSLSSSFLLHSAHVDDEVVTIDRRGGGASGGHASAHSGSSGGRASRSGGSRKSHNTNTGTAGTIPVYAAGTMNHHNNGTILNYICFSSLLFIMCCILIMML
ncbi:hypothetical protein RND71_020801 [Anisodus tanguticus]|uniref:Uncharacterized protein n=1 Tax=Anisodus tanguticus TaxID=243964 RepID=A0AAE1RW63_9SOLA|nr:hypothetical protein RND71_020801 [Anisodus tanguticus]